MTDIPALKKHLMGSKRVSEEAIARAEDYALSANMTLEQALIFTKLMNYASLGQCLSQMYETPYRSLLNKAPSDMTRMKVMQNTAETFGVFPVEFDVQSNTLTLAVSDPADPDLLRKLRGSISASLTFALTVASDPEIRKAIDVFYKGKPYVPERELQLPEGFTIVSRDKKDKESLDLEEESKSGAKILLVEPDLERSRALMTLLRREGFHAVKWVSSLKEAAKVSEEEPADRLVANGRIFRPRGNWVNERAFAGLPALMSFYNIRNMLLGQEHPYAQMSEALLSLVSFVVRRTLQGNEQQLADIVATARQCKLLAMRMGLPVTSVDGAVLAAWLSAPGIGKLLYDHLSSPYPLSEIFEEKEPSSRPSAVEALVLRLVKKYQALKKSQPEIAGDIDKVRKELATGPAGDEDRSMLEAFLNVIRDEEFLKNAGRMERRILIVDPDYSKDSAIALRLNNDGYEVVGVSGAKEAAKIILESGADLVISEVSLPDAEGIRFCRVLRENRATLHLPFFFLTREEGDRLAAQCLEAGADDFFFKPPNLDLLSIKIRNILALKTSRGTRRGITGTLADMSFTDIIQSLTTGEKDVEISLNHAGKKGLIYIQQGEVTYAQAQGLEGQDAFYRMMTWPDGEFEITACAAAPSRNIFESAMSLLMEGARIADEAGLSEEAATAPAKHS